MSTLTATDNPAIERVLARLEDHKPMGDGYVAPCPAHDDTEPSLSIGIGTDGRVLLKCHAGCKLAEILTALELEIHDLFVETRDTKLGEPTAYYVYRDERGAFLSQKVRYTDVDGSKTFRHRVVAGEGEAAKWSWKLGGTRRVLYNLDQIQGQESVCIVEGEKDADTLARFEFIATTNPDGASSWRAAFTEQLQAAGVKRVTIFPDHDDAGRKHAETVATACQKAGLIVSVVEIPDVEGGDDITDWVQQMNATREQIKRLIAGATAWTAAEPRPVVSSEEADTDAAHARRLATIARGFVRYAEPERVWYVYDGKRWKRGSAVLVVPYVHQLAKTFYEMAAKAETRDLRARFAREAQRLETDHVITAVINQARALHEFQIDPLLFDAGPDLLNTQSGTVDLRTGALRPHRADDLISKITPVRYIPTAESRLWNTTVALASALGLDETGAPIFDAEMMSYHQRRAGYCITGHTTDKEFYIDYGGKDRGKTTVNGAVSAALGPDYSKMIRAEALMQRRDPEAIPHEIAATRGMRLVLCAEAPAARRFDEETLKKISGGDVLSACFKYRDEFNFLPFCKLIFYANNRPELSGGDDAVWQRARSVPYDFDFRAYAGHDPKARETLRQPEHLEAVLAWAVRGAVAWHQGGLRTPPRVLKDTAAHRAAVSSVARFLADRCEMAGPGEEFPAEVTVTAQGLHREYIAWERQQQAPERLNLFNFSLELARLGHESREVKVQRNRYFRYPTLRLRTEDTRG